MLQQTKGIVLRSIKYGETSLVTSIFTRELGVQPYLIQGVRTAKTKRNHPGLLQSASLLDLVVYRNPKANLQRLREFQNAHIYHSLQEEVIKNSIALFSVELLLRLLPEQAPLPQLFDFCFKYFQSLDDLAVEEVANLPLFFIMHISRHLGYQLKGNYSLQTPHLHLQEGGFSEHPPVAHPFVNDEDAKALSALLKLNDLTALNQVAMNAQMRFRLIDWYLEFLHQHTQHLGQIRSLAVLRAILH